MNKSILSFLCFCMFNCTGLLLSDDGYALEIRSSAFFHSSQRFRDVYRNVGPSFGIEASKRFCSFDAWVDLDFFSKNSNHVTCCKTTVDILNTSFGIKYSYNLCVCLEAYVGVGPSFSGTWIKNKTCCGKEHLSKMAIGGIVKSGVCYQLCDPFFIDIFIDYLYQPVHFHHSIDIGGVKLGAGLGMKF